LPFVLLVVLLVTLKNALIVLLKTALIFLFEIVMPVTFAVLRLLLTGRPLLSGGPLFSGGCGWRTRNGRCRYGLR